MAPPSSGGSQPRNSRSPHIAPASAISQNLPLHMPGDPPVWTAAVEAVIDAGFMPKRPHPQQLKVGPYNYYPSTGRTCRDAGPTFHYRGQRSFIGLLLTSKTPLPRLTPSSPARLDTLPTSTTAAEVGTHNEDEAPFFDECRLHERPSAASTAAVQTGGSPNPFADALNAFTRREHGCSGFDLPLSDLPAALARAVRELATQHVIDCAISGREVWVRSSDLIHFISPDEDSPF